jgi:carbon monoxide dehydrogenase subunit G
VLGAALVTLVAAFGAAQTSRVAAPFTRQERAQLRAGELVRRPEQQRVGDAVYVGGMSWQRVRAPRDRVWETILDTRLYARLIPGVDRAEVLERRENRRVMYMRHTYLFVSVGYHANVRIDPDSYTIEFDLDRSRPHDIRDGRGFITLDTYGSDETIVTWGVRADVGSGILTGVFSAVIDDWILRVPYCVRGQMEGVEGC